MFPSGTLMPLLSLQVSLIGVLKGLSGAFMPGQVIFFSVVLGAATMGMGSQVMVLGSYLLGFAHDRCRCTYCTVAAPGRQRRASLHNLAGSANSAFQVQFLHLFPLSFR